MTTESAHEHIDTANWLAAITWAADRQAVDIEAAGDALAYVEDITTVDDLNAAVKAIVATGVEVDAPTALARLRLTGAAGAVAVERDPDNAEAWAALVPAGDDPDEVVSAFLDAGRGIDFARRVMALLTEHDQDVHGWDMTLPYADLAERVPRNLSAYAMNDWAEAGVADPTDVYGLVDAGWSPEPVAVLNRVGVPRAGWPAPGPVTTRVLTAHGTGWSDEDRVWLCGVWDTLLPNPDQTVWSVLRSVRNSSGGTVGVGPDVARACIDAGITLARVGQYARAIIPHSDAQRSWVSHLTHRGTPVDETFVRVAARLDRAGVTPSKVGVYRYLGIYNLAHLTDAVTVHKITPDVADHLIATYGVQVGRGRYNRRTRSTVYTYAIENWDHLMRALAAEAEKGGA